MTLQSWMYLSLFFLALGLLTKPMGHYLSCVLDPKARTWLDPVLSPLERWTYRLLRLDPNKEQNWIEYTISLLMFSCVSVLVTYAILRLQQWFPLNPQNFGPVPGHLAWNTAVSFATNTNWQSYSGESTMSYFSQMVALAGQNFWSAAVGIAAASTLVRGLVREESKTVGNFWVDLVRLHYYLLLPLAVVFAVFLVSQGVPQNFSPYREARCVSAPVTAAGKNQGALDHQRIPQGPIASQEAIKLLGTNGGGYTNANSAHPYENPTALSNFFEMLAELVIAAGLIYWLGIASGSVRHAWAIWVGVFLVLLAGVCVCDWAERLGNPALRVFGVDPSQGNLEGKEVRFGIFPSILFACVTTATSTGAVNNMHDSLAPLSGLIPIWNMELGEVIFGGVGSGLYMIIVFVVLAIFLSGLMVGRTPEYLGKKITAYEVKLASLSVLIGCASILFFTALAVMTSWGKASVANPGPHGFSEVLYAFSSATANNGSAFAGLNANTPEYNTSLGLAMFAGRYLMMIPVLALAGALAAKKKVPPSAGTFPVTGPTFVILFVGAILLVAALNFAPALALGPVLEHFLMLSGKAF